MSRHPEVKFTKNGNEHTGLEVGLGGLSEDKETYKVIKSDDFDSEVRIPTTDVTYLDDNEDKPNDNQTSREDNLLSRPAYSRNANKWEAIISDGEVISTHDTHTELKNHYNVGYVQSPNEDNMPDFDVDYELYYNPNQTT